MKRLFWFIGIALTASLTGCLKDDPKVDTIVLMGSEAYVKPVTEVIPDTLLTYIASSTDLTLYDGNTPPDVQGEYVFAPRELIKWNANQTPAGDSLFFRFVSQHNRVTSCDFQETGCDLMHFDTVYLMGNGSFFTAYFELNYKNIDQLPGADYDLERAVIITGEVNGSGDIDHAIYACVNKSVKINQNNSSVSGVFDSFILSLKDRIYIYRVKDGGAAVEMPWYHQTQTNGR